MKLIKYSLILALLSGCQSQPMPMETYTFTPRRVSIQSDAGLAHVSKRIVGGMFDNYDRNGDGLLDKSEIKIPLLVRLLDRNGDKALSPEELHTPLAVKIISKIIRKSSGKIFNLADRDDDSFLNYREFIVANDMDNKATKLYFRLTDKNFDNQIDKSEYEDFMGEAIAIAGEGLSGFPFVSKIFQAEVK